MSAAACLLQSALPISPNSPAQQPRVADGLAEMAALWKSVFESSRRLSGADGGTASKAHEPTPSSVRMQTLDAQAAISAAGLENALQADAADSVRVYVDGAAVAIVVRDAALSQQDAVRYAFDTAQQLTGQRSSLSRLTVNGRTLYHAATSESHAAASSSTRFFAC